MALHFVIMTLKFVLSKCLWDFLVVSKKAQVHVHTAESENEKHGPEIT